jgi:hypothetical protein
MSPGASAPASLRASAAVAASSAAAKLRPHAAPGSLRLLGVSLRIG